MSETAQQEIDGLEEEIARLRTALREAEGKRHKALVRPFGIEPGDVVRSKARGGPWKDGLGRIVTISTPWRMGHKPAVVVNPMKKDGAFGDRQITWFEWEKAPADQTAS